MAVEIAQAARSRNDESDIAFPPPFRWLKRIALLTGLWLAILLTVRLWWGHVAEQRLRAVIDEAHARGEPILPADFAEPAVPDAQNAALTLRTAASALVIGREFTRLEKSPSARLSPDDLKAVAAIAAANGPALQLARRARSQSLIAWNLPESTYVSSPEVRGQRRLGLLLLWSALSKHASGDDQDAVELIRDVLHQIDVMSHGPPAMAFRLGALALIRWADGRIQEIAPELSINDEPSDEGNGATKEQIHGLICDLLEESSLRQGQINAWNHERMMELDGLKYFYRDSTWLTRPLYTFDIARVVHRSTPFTLSFAKPNLPATLQAVPPIPFATGESDLEIASRLFSVLITQTNAPLRIYFGVLAERRATAIELALRLYQVDHGGRYPESLRELLPKYLPFVPADPLAADGRPIGYRPGPLRPILYSVGENGKEQRFPPEPDVKRAPATRRQSHSTERGSLLP